MLLICLMTLNFVLGASSTCLINNGGCDDKCTQQNGVVRCSCNLLGKLEPDGKSCKYKPMLYYAHGRQIDFVYNGTYKLFLNNFKYNQVNVIAHDYPNKRLFYATVGSGMSRVAEMSLNGLRKRTISEVNGTVDGIAYDQNARALYFTIVPSNVNTTENGNISVIPDVNQPPIKPVIFSVMQKPRAIVLDSCRRYMFVSDWGTNEIVRFDQLQNKKSSIVNTGLKWPNGLSLDKVTEKIFWLDAKSNQNENDRIEMANYDGSCRKTISQLTNTHPFALLFLYGELYWTDWTLKRIYKTNIMDGTYSIYSQLQYRPLGIDYFGEIKEDIGEWSSWVSTKSCAADCSGQKERKRVCANPYKKLYSLLCVKTQCNTTFLCPNSVGAYKSVDVERNSCDICLCKVDGGWSEWAVERCSVSCGYGTMKRTRQCRNPTPMNCGADCIGSNQTYLSCFLRKCSVDAHWGPWSNYSSCTTTCGSGVETRIRTCKSLNGEDCSGERTMSRMCSGSPCKSESSSLLYAVGGASGAVLLIIFGVSCFCVRKASGKRNQDRSASRIETRTCNWNADEDRYTSLNMKKVDQPIYATADGFKNFNFESDDISPYAVWNPYDRATIN